MLDTEADLRSIMNKERLLLRATSKVFQSFSSIGILQKGKIIIEISLKLSAKIVKEGSSCMHVRVKMTQKPILISLVYVNTQYFQIFPLLKSLEGLLPPLVSSASHCLGPLTKTYFEGSQLGVFAHR